MHSARVSYLELLALDYLSQFAIDSVVLDRKKVLYVFLEDLFESNLVDLAIRAKPSDLNPNVLEYTLPVDHVFKFVLCFAFFVEAVG